MRRSVKGAVVAPLILAAAGGLLVGGIVGFAAGYYIGSHGGGLGSGGQELLSQEQIQEETESVPETAAETEETAVTETTMPTIELPTETEDVTTVTIHGAAYLYGGKNYQLDGLAAILENNLDALACIVVCGDYEVDVVGVAVCINDTEHGNTQAVCLTHGNLLLQYVNDEECRGQAVEVGDRTEVLLELSTLAAYLQDLTLGEVAESTVGNELIDVAHLLHSLADCGEVGEHAAGPALDNVGHAYGSSEVGNALLGLFLGSDKEDLLTALGNLLQSFSSFVNLSNSLVQVEDMNAVALHEDVRSHSGVPLSLEVTEVTSGLQ